MTKIENPYEKVMAFHETFDRQKPEVPTPFSQKMVVDRAGFKVEEIVEMLYGAADNDIEKFQQFVTELKQAVDKAEKKILKKKKPVDNPLVDEVDALIDLLYFTYGSFYLLGVEPTKLFDIVHEANMGKLFPDGKPRYDPQTHKILKPDYWEAKFAPEAKIADELKQQSNLK